MIAVVLALALVATLAGAIRYWGATRSVVSADRARVTVTDDGRVLATVEARVAATREERYRGLSDADGLAPGSGMLFVYPTEGRRAFVMRDMAVPLDIVFVAANGSITHVYEAPVPPPGTPESALRRYTGRAKWVLEVPRGWADRHGVTRGDHLTVSYPNATTAT